VWRLCASTIDHASIERSDRVFHHDQAPTGTGGSDQGLREAMSNRRLPPDYVRLGLSSDKWKLTAGTMSTCHRRLLP
jgi:hypothetical protein